MRIISRAEWGARHQDGFAAAPLPASEVWLHHTAGPAYGDERAGMRELEAVGQQRFGGGISYTFLIHRSGAIYEGHSIGRQGAHTASRNTAGRGICLVGDYEDATPSAPMLDALVWLLRHGHTKGWWRRPRLTGGHRDVKATACPGRRAYALIAEINHRAANPQEDDMPSPADLWNHLLEDPYVGPDRKPRGRQPAHVLLSHAAANAAYAKEQAGAAGAALAALRIALPDMIAEKVRAALAQGLPDVTVRDRTTDTKES